MAESELREMSDKILSDKCAAIRAMLIASCKTAKSTGESR